MKVLESFEDYEIRLPAGRFNGKMLPEVTLPKKKYSQKEIELQRKRPVLELSDEMLERIQADEAVMSMFSKKKGGYRLLDSMPARYRGTGDRITRLEQENALLRATLRKNEIPIPGEEAGAPITTAPEDGPKEETLGQKIPKLINPLAMNVGA